MAKTFDAEVERLRGAIDCRVLLERAGWMLDPGSTTGSTKYRDEKDRIIVVLHQGKFWFDARDDHKGDVFALVQYLYGDNFGEARRRLRPLAGLSPSLADVPASASAAPIDAGEEWASRKVPRPGSQGWAYMTGARALPFPTLDRALRARVLREGVYGTVLAAHRDAGGAVIGWEMRGPQYKGFSKGGKKGLFWVGSMREARRVCVAEAWIDALSLAALEGWREGTVYASTGGGYGPITAQVLGAVLPTTARLVAATDNGHGGDVLAKRLRALAEGHGVAFGRRRPEGKDWNAELVASRDQAAPSPL